MSDRFYREQQLAGRRLSVPEMIASRRARKAARARKGGQASGGLLVEIDMAGIHEAINELLELQGDVRLAMRRAVRRGGKVLKAAVLRGAPEETGSMLRAIATRVRSYRATRGFSDANVVAVVGPKVAYERSTIRAKVIRMPNGRVRIFSQKQRVVPSKYVHLIAQGVSPHPISGTHPVTKKRNLMPVYHPGFPARNFVADAASRVAADVQRAMMDELTKALQQPRKEAALMEWHASRSSRAVARDLPPLPLIDTLE